MAEQAELTAEQKQRRLEAKKARLAQRIHWPGLCRWCGQEHWQDPRPPDQQDVLCRLCGKPHLGYCGPPVDYAVPRPARRRPGKSSGFEEAE